MSQGQIVLKLLIDAGTNVYVVAECNVQGDFEYTDHKGAPLPDVDVDDMKQVVGAELHIEGQSWTWQQDLKTGVAQVTRTKKEVTTPREGNDGPSV